MEAKKTALLMYKSEGVLVCLEDIQLWSPLVNNMYMYTGSYNFGIAKSMTTNTHIESF